MNKKPQTLALFGGTVTAALIFFGIYFGSGRLTRFDSPLAAYAAATVLAGFAFAYRYLMWIQRPATWRYFKSSLKLFFRPRALLRNVLKLVALLWNNIVLQKFIGKRSHSRWIAHLGMAWGCDHVSAQLGVGSVWHRAGRFQLPGRVYGYPPIRI